MRKTISVAVSAALLTAAVAVFVCTDVKFDNPIDAKGTNFLEGHAKDTGFNVKHALDTNAKGVAAYYWDTANYKRCDGAVPVVSLVGAKSVTITTQDVAVFRKWMHLDGGAWSDLITWDAAHKNVDAKKPRLTRGGGADVPYEENKVPDPGANYVIVYRVEKPECNGKLPADETSRSLIIEEYKAPDTATPTMLLSGSSTVDVKVGDKYTDDGVTVMLGSQNITADALDSVVVKRRGSNATEQKLTKPVNISQITIPTVAGNEGYSYTITYYASRNNKPASPPSVVRIVNVVEQSVSGTSAVIVLTPYKHNNIPGVSKVIEHPDTMMTYGGTYTEKGATAYYVKDGANVAIDANLVTKPTPPITDATSPARRSLSYNLGAGSGYAAATPVTRYVYLVDNSCDGKSPPEITLSGSDNIPAGAEWKYDESWRVTNKDYDGESLIGGASAGYRYLIDFGGMDPKKPVKGTYTITYVGLGGCGSIATKTRVITVQ